MVGVAGDVGATVGSGCGDRTDSGGVGGHLVGVNVVTADVGAVVALVAAALGIAAVVAGGCFSAVAAAIPAGAVATVPVLF